MTTQPISEPEPDPDETPVDDPYDNPDADPMHDVPVGVPDDLAPSETNPLAEPLPDGETAEGLLTDGKDAERHQGPADEHD